MSGFRDPMALKIQIVRCGKCGKPRGLLHTCITRLDRKTKPGPTKIKPKVTFTTVCKTCGKSRGLGSHTCVRSDYKKWKAAHARKVASDKRRHKAAEQRARKKATADKRKAAAAAKKSAGKKPPAPRQAHDYRTCRDTECRRYACIAWKEAYAEAYKLGLDDGYRQGYEVGRLDGYQDGYQIGYIDGLDASPRPHG